jgi:cytochrome c peroxidase
MVVCLGEKGAEMKKRVFFRKKLSDDHCYHCYQCESPDAPLVNLIRSSTGQCLDHCTTYAGKCYHHGGKGIYLQ